MRVALLFLLLASPALADPVACVVVDLASKKVTNSIMCDPAVDKAYPGTALLARPPQDPAKDDVRGVDLNWTYDETTKMFEDTKTGAKLIVK